MYQSLSDVKYEDFNFDPKLEHLRIASSDENMLIFLPEKKILFTELWWAVHIAELLPS